MVVATLVVDMVEVQIEVQVQIDLVMVHPWLVVTKEVIIKVNIQVAEITL